MGMDSFMPIPMISSMVFVSFFPQYWAASIPIPEEMPVYTKFRINIIWLAREPAERAVWLTQPSIITSAEPTAVVIKFWKTMGDARRSISR